MIRGGVKYFSIVVGSFAALDILLNAAINRGYDLPVKNHWRQNEWLVDQRVLSLREWRAFSHRPDVLVALTLVFVTGGATTTLPSDFNTASNTISCLGSGFAGQGGAGAVSGGSGPGAGGVAGGGGAFASIPNYSAHGAGAVVNVQVGTGDTWFDSSATVLAKAASGQTGGQASACIGTVRNSGGNGGSGGAGGDASGNGGGGGGGGGAAGPAGQGNNGANGAIPTHGGGATGDAGNTSANSNGTQFDASHGSGGGADGGDGGGPTRGNNDGASGLNGGSYGGGGGGGGGGGTGGQSGGSGNGGGGGNAFQGLIVIAYTPAGAGGTARSFGFIIG